MSINKNSNPENMTVDAVKNTEINMNDEIINQIKCITRENGITWLAKTCKIILSELVKPNEINICISLCKIMELLEKNESERNGYLHLISLLEAKGVEEMLNDTSLEHNENYCFEGFEETTERAKDDGNTIRETVSNEYEREKDIGEILEINLNSHDEKEENNVKESEQAKDIESSKDKGQHEVKGIATNESKGEKPEICKYWLKYNCYYGMKCRNSHPVICTNTLERGKCHSSECDMYHPKVCWQYINKLYCRKGHKCSYLHPIKLCSSNPFHRVPLKGRYQEIENYQRMPPMRSRYAPTLKNQHTLPSRNNEGTNSGQNKHFLELEEKVQETELMYKEMMKGMKSIEEKMSWMLSKYKDMEMLETRRKLNFPFY